MTTLRQLTYFLSVYETRSITRSAQILNVSQPALTRAIMQLETELDVTLFDRQPRAMAPTKFAQSFVRHANAIFAQLDDAQHEIEHLRARNEETISVGAGPTWLNNILPSVVGKFSRENPDLSIKVIGGYDQHLVGLLRGGNLHFVLSEVTTHPSRVDLVQEELVHARYVIVARRGHPLAGKKKVDLSELTDFPWALPGQTENALIRLQGIFRTQNIIPPVPRLQSTSLSYIVQLIKNSDALSFLVESTIVQNYNNDVVALNLTTELPLRHAGIVMRSDSWISPKTHELMDAIRAFCAANPKQ